MNVTVELCAPENKGIIYNLYPLYVHDLAEIRQEPPNAFGVFEDTDEYKTLQSQQPLFDIWWQKELLSKRTRFCLITGALRPSVFAAKENK